MELIKLFITAERMWNFGLDIYCVRKSLPRLHARGHIAYARSAHLYLQTLDDIKSNMNPAKYTKLTWNGLLTIIRSDKLWAGTWSGMTIEQVLMRTVKTRFYWCIMLMLTKTLRCFVQVQVQDQTKSSALDIFSKD